MGDLNGVVKKLRRGSHVVKHPRVENGIRLTSACNVQNLLYLNLLQINTCAFSILIKNIFTVMNALNRVLRIKKECFIQELRLFNATNTPSHLESKVICRGIWRYYIMVWKFFNATNLKNHLWGKTKCKKHVKSVHETIKDLQCDQCS